MKKREKLAAVDTKNLNLEQNNLFLGDRKVLFSAIKDSSVLHFKSKNLDSLNRDESSVLDIFEIEKLQISVDDIRRAKSFTSKTSELPKVIFLSSFYWSGEVQNALLKVLEETPANTFIYLFGLSQRNFLSTILSRVQKKVFTNTNRYTEEAEEVLSLESAERLDSKIVKKILSLKTVDYNYEKNTENEKKDRESQILFLYALLDAILKNKLKLQLEKDFLEKILKMTEYIEIEGGSPHLFIDWLLLSTPRLDR